MPAFAGMTTHVMIPNLIGIDWGGTKIEGVAMERDGRELLRLREATPRHDYDGCLKAIRAMVDALEQKTGARAPSASASRARSNPKPGSARVRVPAWILASRSRPICRRRSDVTSGWETTPIASPPPRRWTGRGGLQRRLRGDPRLGRRCRHRGERPRPSRAQQFRRRVGSQSAALPGYDRKSPAEALLCGRVGCIETWCSGRAFEAQYLEHKGVELKAAEIMALKREGDHLANLLWRRYIDRVARGLAPRSSTRSTPMSLVMGGGMSNVDELYEDLPPALAARTFSTVFHTRSCATSMAMRAACAVRPGSGRTEMTDRFEFGLALVREAGANARSATSTHATSWPCRTRARRTSPARRTSTPSC